MMNNKISVIIPVFNTEKYLAEAIESVLSQTLKPYEIIVVDDGSTDGSADVARKFEPSIRLLQQQNAGIGAARNSGINSANGEFLSFLDADDLWTNEKLKHQIEFLENNPGIDMVFGSVQQFVSPELPDEYKNNLRKELEILPGKVPGAMLIKKEAFLRVGLFNEKFELGEFIDWFSRATDVGLSCHVTEEIVLKRRIHNTNIGIYKKQFRKDYTMILREALARKRKDNEQR